MKILVDTCVWSLALRRKSPSSSASEINLLRELITQDQIVMIGAVRQEILSGIRRSEKFSRLKTYLQAFPDEVLEIADYELAADFFNQCRQNGIQGSNTDFLICAVANRRNYRIFTVDKDFDNFQSIIPIQLFK